MHDTLKLDSIYQCNCFLGEKTIHPLVSVIDLSGAGWEQQCQLKLGFYAVLLEEYPCGSLVYGRKDYDFSDGTLLFLSPGETVEIGKKQEISGSQGWLLTFHPDLIKSTSLGLNIGDYTFFNYRKEEALHVSLREKRIVCRCLENIHEELHRSIDCLSRILVSKHIELFLDYCTRFYIRQFITRCEANKKIMGKMERMVDDYFATYQASFTGLPTARQCADRLQLSGAYLEDLLKQETGKTLSEYVQFRRLELAQKWLLETDKPIGLIARELGFSSTQYFGCLFRKITGITPDEYRIKNV